MSHAPQRRVEKSAAKAIDRYGRSTPITGSCRRSRRLPPLTQLGHLEGQIVFVGDLREAEKALFRWQCVGDETYDHAASIVHPRADEPVSRLVVVSERKSDYGARRPSRTLAAGPPARR